MPYDMPPFGMVVAKEGPAREREGYTGDVKPPPMGQGQPANQVYPCWCQTPYAMACGQTAQVREYPEVAASRPMRLEYKVRSGRP
jgi:hypothetical protein